MRTRKARASDAPGIFRLIAHYAATGLLLSRSEEEIRRNIGHFSVLEEKGRLLSCVALESYGADLAEIRSLAVAEESQGHGLGTRLIEYALEEARRREIARVFAVTHAPEFFLKQGFTSAPRHRLTEKIARDCQTCSKRRSCRLAAVVATVLADREVFPILGDSPVFAAAQ